MWKGNLAPLAIVVTAAMLISCSDSDDSEEDGFSHYRLTTEFLGERQALSVRADVLTTYVFEFEPNGFDDRDQEWILTSLNDGYYRITNRAFGDSLSLDVINDGVFDRLTLAASEDRSGQKWQLTQLDNNYCRLTNEFLGPDLSLDVTSDTTTPTVVMRLTGEFSGQSWQLSQLGMGGQLDDDCHGSGED